MRRAAFWMMAGAIALSPFACSPSGGRAPADPTQATSGWMRGPPRPIHAQRVHSSSFSSDAEPDPGRESEAISRTALNAEFVDSGLRPPPDDKQLPEGGSLQPDDASWVPDAIEFADALGPLHAGDLPAAELDNERDDAAPQP
jgi:hypothetical protein